MQNMLFLLRVARRTAGYSLVEMLVVLVILLVSLGLSLAAVQKARTAAARADCGNRQRQLALGIHAFASVEHTLPKGCAYPQGTRPPNVAFTHPGMSWHTTILPYVDQASLYEQAVLAHRNDSYGHSSAHDSVGSNVVRLFLCPTESRQRDWVGWGVTSYLGVSGTGVMHYDGVLIPYYPVRFTDITDGTSNTVMIGERPPGVDGEFASWYAQEGGHTCYLAQLLPAGERMLIPSIAVGCKIDTPSLAPGLPENRCSVGHFWSLHPGGANFAFADGSVRFLRYPQSSILPDLATRAGGEIVAVD